MANPWYVTREAVKSVLDIAETSRRNAQVDAAIDAGALNLEGLLNRTFYPLTATRRFDYPNAQSRRSWKLYLQRFEVISVASITVDNGATTLAPGTWFLKPEDGPPFTRIEINLGALTGGFSAGSTHQRAIGVTGVFGFGADGAPAGALAAAITTTSAVTCNVTDSSAVGVGSILLVDTERMTVTGRALLSTGQTLLTPIGATESEVTLSIASGAAVSIGEVITLDAERMRVDDIAGNNLTVERAVDGSVLAAHTAPTIYAPRTLTVVRGALGTTAATHLNAAPLATHVPPGPVSILNTAYALNTLLQQQAGYARIAGSGDHQREFTGRGIKDLEADAVRSCGRSMRYGAVV